MDVRRRSRSLSVLMLITFAVACADAAETEIPVSGDLPPGHVPISGAAAPAAATAAIPVRVLETMNSGGYTYARVSTQDGEAWVAGPETPMEVGQQVVVTNLMQMENFTSSSLGRTFDVLYFASSYDAPGVTSSPSGMHGGPAAGSAEAPADLTTASRGTVVERVAGGGYLYVRVAEGADTTWLAAPMMQVDEGQSVSWQPGMTMTNFTSPTLDRTFDKLVFVDRLLVIQ